MTDAERITKITQDRGEFVTADDGYVYYYPNEAGALSAHDLRVLAVELDRRNAAWDQTVRAESGGRALSP